MIERLEKHLVALDDALVERAAFDAAEADLAFHEEILIGSGNHLLLETWANLADRLAVVMTRVHHDRSLGAMPGGAHRDVVAALAANDGAGAETSMQLHLSGASAAYQMLSAAAATALAS